MRRGDSHDRHEQKCRQEATTQRRSRDDSHEATDTSQKRCREAATQRAERPTLFEEKPMVSDEGHGGFTVIVGVGKTIRPGEERIGGNGQGREQQPEFVDFEEPRQSLGESKLGLLGFIFSDLEFVTEFQERWRREMLTECVRDLLGGRWTAERLSQKTVGGLEHGCRSSVRRFWIHCNSVKAAAKARYSTSVELRLIWVVWSTSKRQGWIQRRCSSRWSISCHPDRLPSLSHQT
ncbi:hypothetical protein PIB30_024042 [Stylosanthes scabra]|uniref:Uncharacterized protein n=1 Tax=Stylosanthes scabra TaxID=79078 RepID=A0ABU6R9Z3_9FABA|nr:hypothetical protein [Stylosanthes scabra]